MTGPREPLSWFKTDGGDVGFYDLKGVIEALLAGLNINDACFEPTQRPGYYPGRVARLVIDGEHIGVLGELYPAVIEAYDLPADRPVLVADLDLDTLLTKANPTFRIEMLSRFPAVQQDIALVLDESTPADEVERQIRQSGGPLLKEVRLFDVYRGESLPAHKKSLAYRLTFQAPDKTLTDKIVAGQQARIVKQLEKTLGATLRS
jgi:phenylalanyl-tRNA synthetase beta chain